MARRTEVGLDRRQILDAAFRLLEREGLDALSMRSLGTEMGVHPTAVYWHFDGKAELLSSMAGEIYAEARRNVPACGDWRTWLQFFGTSLRNTLLSRRDAARLCVSADATPQRSLLADREFRAPLTALGLDKDDAIAFEASIIALTLGWCLFQSSQRMEAFLAGMMDIEATYYRGLQALIRGFDPKSACMEDA